MRMKKLLFVEDNPAIAAALQHALRTSYEIVHTAHGKTALYKTDVEDFDLILLDLVLPDIPGQIVCQQLRERGVTTPIMVISAEDAVLTKIALFDRGANDYLVKPFSLGELKARIRAQLRPQTRAITSVELLQAGTELTLNPRTRLAERAGVTIHLRRKEYAILECLLINQGIVVTRQTLTRYAWDGGEENWTNTIDVHIKHLRDKIDRPFTAPLIRTVHGIGYQLLVPSTHPAPPATESIGIPQ